MLHCTPDNQDLDHEVDPKLGVAQVQMVKGRPKYEVRVLAFENWEIAYFFGTCELSPKNFVGLENAQTRYDGIGCRNCGDDVACHLFNVEPGLCLNSEND